MTVSNPTLALNNTAASRQRGSHSGIQQRLSHCRPHDED